MTTNNFEPYYAALFELLKFPELNTRSRRLRHWSEVPSGDQPALFMIQTGESSTNERGKPSKWFLGVELYLYVSVEDENVAPSTIMNPILAKIRDRFTPSPGMPSQDLGFPNQVSHCWISESIEIYDGFLGNQAVALIPMEILSV